ncbi:MAG: MFS transporter [Gammaproteobacteria bacterium]|mgnify:FL=1|nr:MFS transporter [Gammaproteobacteria bacterium]
MSTVVVVRKNNSACIAADSLTSFGDTKQAAEFIVNSDKIIQFADFYMGIVGSAAHQLVLKSLFNHHADKIDFSNQLAIFNSLKQIHPILKDEYYLNSKDEDEDPYESSRVDSLIMTSKGIYGLYSLREVDEYTQYWAIGSGAEYALGAMFTVYDQLDSAEQIALAGVKAGAKFDNASDLPFTSFTLQLTH